MAWHDATCAALKLEWEDGRPGCLACQRKAPALAPIHPISPPGPPPDVPRSQLVCRWPPRLFPDSSLAGSRKVATDPNHGLLSEASLDGGNTPCLSCSEDGDRYLIRKNSQETPASEGNKFVPNLESDEDGSGHKDTSEDAEGSTRDIAEDGNARTLAFIRANIDEWTSSNITQESQMLSKPPHEEIDRSHNPPEADTSFRSTYTSLPNADSVRLLRLHGTATKSDPIHCTLLVHGLHDPCRPTFEAFSYTWADSQGDSSLCEVIFVGPHYDILPVTKNCLAALRCFRTSVDRLVWVDAICINQFDLDERGRQVSLMRDVYKSAARVLTYLGGWNEDLGDVTESPHYNHGRSDHLSGSAFADISTILCSPYFSRIWVIQEVLLNKSATLSVDKHTIHWKNFWNNARHSLSCQDRKSTPVLIEHFNSRDGNMDLFSWLKATKDSRCGDLRDRVYGLMGLTPDRDRRSLPVDYSISKQQLYIGLAMYWLTIEAEYGNTVSVVLDMALRPKITLLPSWAPDWTSQPHTNIDEECRPPMSLTLRLDTTSIEGPSSGLKWPSLGGRVTFSDLEPRVRWTLDETFQGQVIYYKAPHWITLARDAHWTPLASVQPLSLGGTLALEAVHILSISKGKLELTDCNGRQLDGLRLEQTEDFEPGQENHSRDDVHLYVSWEWGQALVLRKHAQAVYSLRNRFRIVCAPIPSPSASTSKDDMRLKYMEIDISEHWLRDIFFHGICAGSAYAHLSRGSGFERGWFGIFPEASAACEDLNLSFDIHIAEDRRRSILALMTEISEDVRDSIDEIEIPWKSRISHSRSMRGSDTRHVREGLDGELAGCIRNAVRRPTASSPEELCEYLKSIVKAYRNSCKDYLPLRSVPFDLCRWFDESSSLSPLSSPLTIKLWNSLMDTNASMIREDLKSPYMAFFKEPAVALVHAAWALLQDVKVDSKFTLEQNFNILWVHVLTMEMVARLRGCIQQRLILKAFVDKMKSPQKIYLI